jgi:hypothetical protein
MCYGCRPALPTKQSHLESEMRTSLLRSRFLLAFSSPIRGSLIAAVKIGNGNKYQQRRYVTALARPVS